VEWFITEYNESYAESLAQMWNESDSVWPGGFTGGVPFTQELILQWQRETRAIAVYLVIADDRVVGYCELTEYPHEREAAYVELLGVHPAYHKQGFGRELLKKSVAKSIEHGYKRLDLGTWAGNLRAVPLYKKTGFFWVPETQVHMQNFLPLILPLAPEYFQQVDWYANLQRDLSVTEDDVKQGAMKVYPYAWEKDGHILKATIDREARGLTALETDDFAVSCTLDVPEVLAGIPAQVRWEIVNKRAEPLAVSLLAEGEPGLAVHKQASPDTLQLLGCIGASLTVTDRAMLEAEVLAARDIAEKEKDEPAHKIKSTVIVNGRLIPLETGARVRQPIEVSPEPLHIAATVGLRQTTTFRLRNYLDRPVPATLHLTAAPGLTCEPAEATVELPAKGFAGVPVTLEAREAGALSLWAYASFEHDDGLSHATVSNSQACDNPSDGQRVLTRLTDHRVVALEATGVTGYVGEREAVLENATLRLVLPFKGRRWEVRDRATDRPLLREGSVIGPPFWPSEFDSKRFSARLEHGAATVTAILSAASERYPDLTFQREITLGAGPVVTVRHRLINAASEERHLQLAVGHRADWDECRVAIPTAEGLVVDDVPSFPDWYDQAGKKPENLSETWVAYQQAGTVVGFLWPRALEHEFGGWQRFPQFKFALPPLPARGSVLSDPLYLYVGHGDWQAVRAAWRQLIAPAAPASLPAPRPVVLATTDPTPPLLLDGAGEVQFRLDSARSRALRGTVRLELPTGWSIEPGELTFADLKRGQPFVVSLRVQAPIHYNQSDVSGPAPSPSPASAEARVTLTTELATQVFPLPLLALGSRRPVHILEGQEQSGQRVVILDNGWLCLKVAPDFTGALVALERGGVNHLLSSFPEARAFVWMNPWFGGVGPVLLLPNEEEAWPGHAGHLHEERVAYELLPAAPEAAIPWAGVRVACDFQRPSYEGLRLETDYLTVGGSNVVVVVSRLINLTTAPRPVVYFTNAFLQPGGTVQGTILHYGQQRTSLRADNNMWLATTDPWAAVENPASGDVCVLINATAGSELQAFEMGSDGAHLFQVARFTLEPAATREFISYLVLAQGLEQARRYAALAAARICD
jgi:ribosomal protein S18 acetylase RimI-like enzyme